MNIEKLDPADTRLVDSWFDLQRIAWHFDGPDEPPQSRHWTLGLLQRQPYGHRSEIHVAVEGGAVVGSVQITLPLLDNTATGMIDLLVHPNRRRRGIGRCLADHAIDVIRTDGRIRVIGEVKDSRYADPDGLLPGPPFAESLGAKRALSEVRRRLRLDTVDDEALAALQGDALAHANGFRIQSWVGPTPDDLAAGFAVLEARMSTDIPLGDLTWEPEHFDVDRLRGVEDDLAAIHRTFYTTAVIHGSSGDVAGMTRVVRDADVPEHAWQWNTIVLPAHRGHRLGLLLKVANLAQLRAAEPQLQTVDTWNAADNPYMIAVNEAMGFEPIEVWAEWELAL